MGEENVEALPREDGSAEDGEHGVADPPEARPEEYDAKAKGLPRLQPDRSMGQSKLSVAGAGYIKLKMPVNPVPDLQFLTFKSWWTEFNTKRYMEICFDMSTELFQIILDKEVRHLDKDQIYCPEKESLAGVVGKDTKIMSMRLHEKLSHNQHAESMRRAHLTCWDLHVGAKLNILGKPTTLLQANLETGQWLDYQAAKLTTISNALEEQLLKYESAHQIPKQLRTHTIIGRGKPPPGSADLRSLLKRAGMLKDRLSRYRPIVANGIMAYL
eukprot:scaffold235918_cov35-Tisochrysis_lutea.AAC.2